MNVCLGSVGVGLHERGEHAEAVACFRAALRHQEDARSCNNLGVAMQRRGDAERAAGLYRRACELDPSHEIASQNLGRLNEEGGRAEGVLDRGGVEAAWNQDYAVADLGAAVRYAPGQVLRLRVDGAPGLYRVAAVDPDTAAHTVVAAAIDENHSTRPRNGKHCPRVSTRQL